MAHKCDLVYGKCAGWGSQSPTITPDNVLFLRPAAVHSSRVLSDFNATGWHNKWVYIDTEQDTVLEKSERLLLLYRTLIKSSVCFLRPPEVRGVQGQCPRFIQDLSYL